MRPWCTFLCLGLLRAERPIKCGVLTESECENDENNCAWYLEAGCREKCGFITEDGCNYYPEECVFSDEQTCEAITEPSQNPINSPSSSPSIKANTQNPTSETAAPTKYPTEQPSLSPTAYPTLFPTNQPTTSHPTTKSPTKAPSTSDSPTNSPTKKPTNYPTEFPTKQPTYPPFNPVDESGFVVHIHVGNSQTYSSYQEDLKEAWMFAIDEYKVTQDPSNAPQVSLDICYSKFINDEEITDSELCHRFQHFVNKNMYRDFDEDSETRGYTFSARISNIEFHRPSLIVPTWVKLQEYLDTKSVPITIMDFHADVTYGKQATVRLVPNKKPNVVFILADDLGWADVGYQACKKENLPKDQEERLCSPSNLTPHLDALAHSEGSAVFSRFYTTSQCGPSRSSFLTGRQPIRECMLFNIFRPVPDGKVPMISPLNCVKSLAEFVRDNNGLSEIDTWHGGKWHVAKLEKEEEEPDYVISSPIDNGFDEFIATPRQAPTYRSNCGCFEGDTCEMGAYNTTYFKEHYLQADGFSRKYMADENPDKFLCEHYKTKDGHYETLIEKDDSTFLVDQFEDFIKSREEDTENSFFANVWFHAPHGPYVASADHQSKAAKLLQTIPIDEQTSCGIIFDQQERKYSWKEPCNEMMTQEECAATCRQIKLNFYGSIIAMDEEIGRLVALLKETTNHGRSLYENTLIFFGSDNGSARYDASADKKYVAPSSVANLDEFKFSPHEGGTRVPFIMHFPSLFKENIQVTHPASSYDLLPTVMEVMQVQYDQDKLLDGMSLLSLVYATQAGSLTKFRREKEIAIVTVDIDVLFLTHNRSVVHKEGKSANTFDVYEFDYAANKLVSLEDDPQTVYEMEDDRFHNWRAAVFDDSPCKEPAIFLDRNDFCDRNSLGNYQSGVAFDFDPFPKLGLH